MTSPLHEDRIAAVLAALQHSKAARVLDLGCGTGDLLVRLAMLPQITRLVGLDIHAPSLAILRARLARMRPRVAQIDLRLGSMIAPAADLAGYDCALLVETIEHLRPADLSRLEKALFRTLRPASIVITTPNAEFNPLLGVPAHRMRHPGHHFEWDRAQFRRWCGRAAQAGGYRLTVQDICGAHPACGGASQMGIFTRQD